MNKLGVALFESESNEAILAVDTFARCNNPAGGILVSFAGNWRFTMHEVKHAVVIFALRKSDILLWVLVESRCVGGCVWATDSNQWLALNKLGVESFEGPVFRIPGEASEQPDGATRPTGFAESLGNYTEVDAVNAGNLQSLE